MFYVYGSFEIGNGKLRVTSYAKFDVYWTAYRCDN